MLACLLATCPVCAAWADDIDPYRDALARTKQPLMLKIDLPGWPGGSELVCEQLASASCQSRLGSELSEAAQALDLPEEQVLLFPDLARAALYAVIVDFAESFSGPSLSLSIVEGNQVALFGPRVLRGETWREEFLAALKLREALTDSVAQAGEALERLDACGHSLVIRPLAGPLAGDRSRYREFPRQLFVALRSLLRGAAAPGFSLAGPLLHEDKAGQGAWLLPMAKLEAKGGSGNIKKLGYKSGRLWDSRAEPVDFSGGRLGEGALTLWTDPDDSRLLGAIPGIADDGRDGGSVVRGGVGSRMGLPRRLVTEDPGQAGKWFSLEAEGAREQLMPYLDPDKRLSPAEQDTLWRWLLGEDAMDDDRDGNRSEQRDWLLGDVLHSRPVLVDYGARRASLYSASHPDVRLVFGSNDGLLRMIRDREPDGSPSGEESFAFLPLEMLPLQARRSGLLSQPGQRHDYGMDGEGLLLIRDLGGDGVLDSEDGDYAWVIMGQRRGGSYYYGIDVSQPDAPTLGWKIGPASPGFEQLGLSFSKPQDLTVNWQGKQRRVLLFGGGYNGGVSNGAAIGKDAGRGNDDRGNAAYIVDAFSGELLWRARGPSALARVTGIAEQVEPGLRHGVASEFSSVDLDGDGVRDVAYVGDTGGDVWRLFLGAEGPSGWRIQRLATLGGEGIHDRRFFHAPDIAAGRDDEGDYLALILSSGNRASPLALEVEDSIYLLKERLDETGFPLSTEAILHDALPLVPRRCNSAGGNPCPVVADELGWRFPLSSIGEKGFATPLTTEGVVAFTSYVPPDPAVPCADPRGSSRLYLLRMRDGSNDPSLRRRLKLPDWGSEEALELGPGIAAPLRPARSGILLPLPEAAQDSPLLEAKFSKQYRLGWWHWGIDPE